MRGGRARARARARARVRAQGSDSVFSVQGSGFRVQGSGSGRGSRVAGHGSRATGGPDASVLKSLDVPSARAMLTIRLHELSSEPLEAFADLGTEVLGSMSGLELELGLGLGLAVVLG